MKKARRTVMEKTQEKKYLKWYHKVGYGSGDIAGNCVYQLLTSFIMIYLTDTVGLNMGIVGTLIALSKVFDGVTDFFFGRMMTRHTPKWVKLVHGCFGHISVVQLHLLLVLQFLWNGNRLHSMCSSLFHTHFLMQYSSQQTT